MDRVIGEMSAYGLALGAVPSKRIPDLVDRITGRYVNEKQNGESFQAFCQRVGKKSLKETVDEFTPVPAHNVDPSFYSDWGDPRQFSIGDLGMGECAGANWRAGSRLQPRACRPT